MHTHIQINKREKETGVGVGKDENGPIAFKEYIIQQLRHCHIPVAIS